MRGSPLVFAAVAALACSKEHATGTVEFDLEGRLGSGGTDAWSLVHVAGTAMASGVVSASGYNAGLYVVSYHRIELDGEVRDLFLTFDVPVSADRHRVEKVLVRDSVYTYVAIETPDGTPVLTREKKAATSLACIQELYFDNEGQAGGVFTFAIDLGDMRIRRGVFQASASAASVEQDDHDKDRSSKPERENTSWLENDLAGRCGVTGGE